MQQKKRREKTDGLGYYTYWDKNRDCGCIYCGDIATTREHVPSKTFLIEPYPDNLSTIPACFSCNNGFSFDEQYCAYYLEILKSNIFIGYKCNEKALTACLKLLTDERMKYIAKKVSDECSRNPDNMSIKYLKSSIKEIDEAIENMWISIEKGGDAISLTERINRRQEEKERLEAQLAEEQNKRVILTEAQVLAFLNYVCELPGNDMMKRRAIINIFVHSIYLYDDHLTLIINGSNKPVTVDDIPFDDIEAAFNGEKAAMEQCSHSSDIVPPNESQTNTYYYFFTVGFTVRVDI